METKFKITVPTPCHEDWEKMTPEESGRFCASCIKSVVDFTGMKTAEIQDYFLQNQTQKVCGRFKNEQLSNTFDIEIPQSAFAQKMPFHKAFLLTLFVVMGSTLFSCKNHDDATLGEIALVKDTVEIPKTTTGIIIIPKHITPKADSVKHPSKIEKMVPTTTGEVAVVPNKTVKKDYYLLSEVDKRPSFPGGTKKFYEYIYSHLNLTEEEKKTDHRILVGFTIEKDGSLTNPGTLPGTGGELNQRLVTLLRSSPKWEPGQVNDENVRVECTFPVRIKP